MLCLHYVFLYHFLLKQLLRWACSSFFSCNGILVGNARKLIKIYWIKCPFCNVIYNIKLTYYISKAYIPSLVTIHHPDCDFWLCYSFPPSSLLKKKAVPGIPPPHWSLVVCFCVFCSLQASTPADLPTSCSLLPPPPSSAHLAVLPSCLSLFSARCPLLWCWNISWILTRPTVDLG